MEEKVYARKSSGLVRDISVADALVYNLANMGVLFVFLYTTWGSALYPGAYLPATALVAIPLGLPIALLYAYMSASMPRSGGDYIWVSRILHPAIGFMISLPVAWLLLLSIGFEPLGSFGLGISVMFKGLSIAMNDPNLMNVADMVALPEVILALGVIYTVLLGFLMTRGVRTTMKVQWALFLLSALGGIVYIIALLGVGPTAFKANFNAISGLNYDSVIKTANEAGYSTVFTTSATLIGVVYTFLNLLGYVYSTYVAGEIKDASRARTQLVATTCSLTLLALLMFAIYQVSYYVMGGEFIGAISYLAESGHQAYTLPFEPFLHALVTYATLNPIVIILVGLGFAATPLLAGLAYIFLVVRLFFAWSFDRVMPTSLSKVDDRFHSPYVATIVVIILGIIFDYMWLYVGALGTFILYMTTIWCLGYVVVGIAAIVFPYRKKEIFEASPSFVKAKIGGIPLVSIFGIVTVAVASFLVCSTLVPSFGGSFEPYSFTLNMLPYPVALMIYAISSYYRRKTGIPLEYSFKEIPPV
jgi:amino acid transporter